jgi:histidinol-phosphate aminotransferase
VIGREAVAFLEAAVQPQARAWLAQGLPQLKRWRARLAGSLQQLGLPVREGPATFLLAKVGDAAGITAQLRSHDVRVRDSSSFGLRQWIRLSAQPPAAQKALLTALKNAL